MVLRKVSQATRDPAQGRLLLQARKLLLKGFGRQPLPRPWNVEHLKRYYQ